ncbi:MAG: D-alanyl-D-alanine carboxypeptidase/D-alanyl-D-alanine-endopeptidase [Acidobacteriota bacterium]
MKNRYSHYLLCLCILLLALALLWPTSFLTSTARGEESRAGEPVPTVEPGFLNRQADVELPSPPPQPAEPVEAKPEPPVAFDPGGPYAEIGRKIQAIINKPAYRRAEWGLDVRALEDDSPIFVHNSDRLFPPASNLKLFTTSTALDRLGPDFRFTTQVAYEGSLGPAHRLTGNLVLFGQGDPDLGGSIRTIPSQFAHFDTMAQKVREFGITEIEGDVIGDDSYFTFAPYGDGWMPSDLVRDYGAPISALSFNNNLITLSLRPSRRVGLPASASVYPSESLLNITNKTRTVRRGRTSVRWYRTPGTDNVSLRGQVPLRGGGTSQSFLVKDPALYTARLLRERLIKSGIRVKGVARARHAGDGLGRPPAHLIYAHESPPLLDIISHTNKKSQNLYAEILLRALGAQVKGIGSDQAGLEVVYEFLAEAGITPASARLHDGSGLSRYNLITPRSETMLLAHVASKPYFSDFMDTLAISGLDGTLRGRMVHGPGFLRVFAKTGSLQSVTTLGGYVRANSGKIVSFSILNNNHSYSSDSARRAIDQICNLLTQL